ncbi:MAG TPA: hypothetical protein VK063_10755 [Beutenbergiaceae bacterium]|nr:hypothetical protein [Beutenbergiaceae bacterium]
MRPVRWVLSLALLLLAACAPAAPVAVPEPTQAPDAQVQARATTFETMLREMYDHFLTSGTGSTQYISAGATPAQAAAELQQSIGLGEQAHRFALATSTELARKAAATTSHDRITDVEIQVSGAEVLGEENGQVIVATTIDHRVASRRGPIIEQTVTYAVGWRGEELFSVGELLSVGSLRGLDAGVGLSSPLGAVRRYVELVQDDQFDAVVTLSGGANDDPIAFDVLASVVNSSEATHAVTLPQQTEGSLHVVYLLNSAEMVIGRFEVTMSDPTQVVYFPTA